MMRMAVVKDRPPIECIAVEASASGFIVRGKRFRFHPAFFAVFTLLFVFLLSFVYSAMGYNAWRFFVSWDDETMKIVFSKQGNITWRENKYYLKPAIDDAFFQKLEELELTTLMPSWMPDGFTLERADSKIERTHDRWAIGMYTCGDRQLQIGVFKDISFGCNMWIEKDEREPEIYERGGITFYIMDNLKRAVVQWFDPPYKINICGHVSREELKQMIDSMFVRK